MDKVEVAFATPNKQLVIEVTLTAGDLVEQVIERSGILNKFPEIDLSIMKLGMFGKLCKLDKRVERGDRIEIYRPLLQNPMDARRSRAIKIK